MVENVVITTSKKEKILLGFILLLALFFYLFFICRTAFCIKDEIYFTLIDDAMISMRYAKNLSHGDGLVWNVGQLPVEGFTNLGWTLYMSLLHKIPVPESKISLLVMFTSVAILLANIYLAYLLTKEVDDRSSKAPLIAAIIVAFYFPLVFWSLRGMEVGVATFFVLLLVVLVFSSKPINIPRALWIGSIMLLSILLRFDIVLQVTLILGYVLFYSKSYTVRYTPILIIFTGYLIGVVGISLFQYSYFGYVFPNTYYLKVIGITLIERMMVGVQTFIEYASRDFIAPLLIIVAGVSYFRTLRHKKSYFLLALFLIQCIYSIYVGGDYAEPLNLHQVEGANRFIAQGLPSVIILFSIVIDRFTEVLYYKQETKASNDNNSIRLVFGIGISVIVLMSGSNWFNWIIHNAPLLDSDIWRTRLAIHIKDSTDENAVIAVHAAGQIPYYSDRRTIDLLGKSDPVVAMGPSVTSFRPGHNKWNYEYSILELCPDIVADEWGQSSIFLATKSNYSRLDNGIWVSRNKMHYDIGKLEGQY